MNDDLIKFWAEETVNHYDYLDDNESVSVNESTIPHDIDTIEKSFNGNVIADKFAPTVEFLETAYDIFNSRFFDDKLPSGLKMVIKTSSRNSAVGCASYQINRITNSVRAVGVTLNAANKLTIHDWLEVVLHEMVHIYDYQNNPQHFVGYMRRFYDAHGKWFLDFGKQFQQYGFNVQKYCKSEVDVNTDDKRIQNSIKKAAFILLDGFASDHGGAIIKLSNENDVGRHINMLYEGLTRGRFSGTKRFVVLKSDNPQIVKLKSVRMNNSRSGMSYFYFNENFKQKYGPFKE